MTSTLAAVADSHQVMGISSSPLFSLAHPGTHPMVSEGFRRGVHDHRPAHRKDVP